MNRDLITEALEGKLEGDEEYSGFPVMVISEPPVRKTNIVKLDTEQDLKDDYSYARDVILSTIEQQQELIKNMATFISAAPSPRAFEVINQMMKTATENAKDLVDLQKKLKDIQQEEQSKKSKQQGNTVIVVGGPMDILDRENKIIDI